LISLLNWISLKQLGGLLFLIIKEISLLFRRSLLNLILTSRLGNWIRRILCLLLLISVIVGLKEIIRFWGWSLLIILDIFLIILLRLILKEIILSLRLLLTRLIVKEGSALLCLVLILGKKRLPCWLIILRENRIRFLILIIEKIWIHYNLEIN